MGFQLGRHVGSLPMLLDWPRHCDGGGAALAGSGDPRAPTAIILCMARPAAARRGRAFVIGARARRVFSDKWSA